MTDTDIFFMPVAIYNISLSILAELIAPVVGVLEQMKRK